MTSRFLLLLLLTGTATVLGVSPAPAICGPGTVAHGCWEGP